jgi:hypothetical protein
MVAGVLLAGGGFAAPLAAQPRDTTSTANAVPVRDVSAVIARSAQPIGSITSLRALSDGSVFVLDFQKRQLVRFDPSLSSVLVVADSAPGAMMPYPQRPIGMLPYLGDSTLVADPSTMSLVVLDKSGRTARVMASPRPNDINTLGSVNLGTHAFDAKGRLYYRQGSSGGPSGGMAGMFGSGMDRTRGGGQGGGNQGGSRGGTPNRGGGDFGGGGGGPPGGAMGGGNTGGNSPFGGPGGRGFNPANQPDSVPIVRVDFDSRAADTVTFVKVPKNETQMTRGEDGGTRLTVRINPMPQADDWALLADGTVAVIRVLDYHVDYYRPDGTHVASEKLPFDWKRITDDDKVKLVDSLQTLAKAASQRAGGGGGFRMNFEPIAAERLPDYYPPVRQGSSIADRNGGLWVVPTTSSLSAQLAQQMGGMMGGMMGGGMPGGRGGDRGGDRGGAGAGAGGGAPGARAAGQPPAARTVEAPADSARRGGMPPAAVMGMMAAAMNQPPLVYDVIDSSGTLAYRVKLPPGRQIAGFGPDGLIYLQARDGRQLFLETVKLR